MLLFFDRNWDEAYDVGVFISPPVKPTGIFKPEASPRPSYVSRYPLRDGGTLCTPV